jgi:hypothetical protein
MKFRLWLSLFTITCVTACGIAVSHHLGSVTLGEAIYDDRCGLQDYFDRMALGAVRAPEVIGTQEMEKVEGKRASGGRTHYRFSTDGQLAMLRTILANNWRRLPESLADASQVDMEVRWSERAENRFVVMTEDAKLMIGQESYALPYHHCLSALLYGQGLYQSRRILLNLPPLTSGHHLPDAGWSTDTALDR